MRAGIGYDIHRLVKGRKLILGGIEIPFAKGFLGHSDGDVLHHAVIDAVLGAAALGDIGEHFSDQDPKNKGCDSLMFVKKTKKLLTKNGLRVVQIDSVVVAEKPRISDYKNKIQKNLAKVWCLEPGFVGVKAKTNEGLDAVGRGKAIECHAVVVLEPIKKGKK